MCLEIPCTHDLSTPRHNTSKAHSLCLTACGRSNKVLSIYGVMQGNLELN